MVGKNGQPSQHVARCLNNIVQIVCNSYKNPEPVIGSDCPTAEGSVNGSLTISIAPRRPRGHIADDGQAPAEQVSTATCLFGGRFQASEEGWRAGLSIHQEPNWRSLLPLSATWAVLDWVSRFQGEPAAMPRNIEIKAGIAGVDDLIPRAAAIADKGHVDIAQDDTFFRCESGLKLRTLSRRQASSFYRRPDQQGPKESYYRITPTNEPDTSCETHPACGRFGRVRKQRTLFLVGRTRIHLDRVKGWGHFLELEVVLEDTNRARWGCTRNGASRYRHRRRHLALQRQPGHNKGARGAMLFEPIQSRLIEGALSGLACNRKGDTCLSLFPLKGLHKFS